MKRILTMLFALVAPLGAALAQVARPLEDVNHVVDLTFDSLAKAQTARVAPGSSRRDGHPVLFLVGNSTMRNGTLGNGNNGQWGWGYYAPRYFDERKITVENQALGGMSSRTFYTKLWPAVRDAIRPGDWVIISIGHNDNGPYDSGRARASIPGTGRDSLRVTIRETGEEETVYTYGEYLRRFIRDTRARGGQPVLMSLTPRDAYGDDGRIVRKPHTQWCAYVAAEEGVPFVDLNEISGRKLDGYSHWKEQYHFYGDHIHSSRFGAEMNARSAAEGIMESENPMLKPLQAMMKDVALPRYEVRRVKGRPVVWLTGDSTVKNEDDKKDGMWGWGSQAYTVFDSTKVTCFNAAKAGRSTRTYINEGRWERVYNSLQPGDFVLIEFGHNDIGGIDKDKERGVIASAKDTSHVYHSAKTDLYEVVYSFGWYLRKMIDDAEEKGATPVLVSLTPRNEWDTGKVERRNDTYGRWYREVVKDTGVAFVDLHNITADWLDRHCGSKEKAAKYYNHDHTHTSLAGARLNAKSVAKGLRDIHSPLAAMLK